MERAIEVAVDVIHGCDYAGISLVGRRRQIETRAATSNIARLSDQLQREVQQGPCLDVLHHPDMVICPDLTREPRWPSWAGRVVGELGLGSMLCLRLFTTQQSLGALSLYSTRIDAIDPGDQATGLALAAHIAVAVAASRDIDHRGEAMLNRTVIGQAEGVLMERYDLTPEQAFTFLKRVSQDNNTKLVDVAIQLVQSRRTPSGEP